jgi:hypothetical protein
MILVKLPHRSKLYLYLNEEDAKLFNPPHSTNKVHIASFYFEFSHGRVSNPVIKIKNETYENESKKLLDYVAKYFNGLTPKEFLPLHIHVTTEEFSAPDFEKVLELKRLLRIGPKK